MRERSYNKNHCCEICGKRTVNGYFRCVSHRIITQKSRENMGLAQLKRIKEGRHNCWKGDEVGYRALHHWVDRWLGRPKKCKHCGKDGLIGHQIHWANISGKYLRKLTDWIRLCSSCHGAYDSKQS